MTSASLVVDVGWERRELSASGFILGTTLTHRFDWSERWKSTLRGDVLAGGVSATLDFWPSVWILTRLEYSHRESNQPLFSGAGGITGPNGLLPSPAIAASFTPDLRPRDDRLIFNVTLRL